VDRVENGSQARLDSRQLLEAAKGNRLDSLGISEADREMIAHLYENSLVERFIIQYKNAETGRKVQDIASISVARSFTIAAELDNGRNSAQGTDRANVGNLEVIVLREKTNPAELAATLKAAGMAAEIAYIQPDHLLSIAGLGLSHREITDEKAADTTPGSVDDGIFITDAGIGNRRANQGRSCPGQDCAAA